MDAKDFSGDGLRRIFHVTNDDRLIGDAFAGLYAVSGLATSNIVPAPLPQGTTQSAPVNPKLARSLGHRRVLHAADRN
jgi:hypothetical protein